MMEKIYKDFKQNMFAIHQLTERDKKHENAQTFLGELWEILNPLIMTVVMVLVFGGMFDNKRIENYPLYIITGITLFNLFSQGTTNCLRALVGNKNLLIKSQLKRSIYVVQKVLTVFRNFLFSLFIYAFIIALFRQTPRLEWLLVIPDILFLLILILGIGKFLAIFNVFFADITYFYQVFTVFLFYGSALFYDLHRLPKLIQNIMMLNPIYDAVYIARNLIIYENSGELKFWIALVIYSIGMYVFGTIVFNKYSDSVVAEM